MRQDDAKAKSSLFSKLPRISPVSRILLFVGIFIIVALPLFFIYSQQQARQDELNQQYSILEKALGTQTSPDVVKKGMDGDLKIAQNELNTIKTVFPNPDQIPETIDSLIELAKSNSIEITKMKVVSSRSSISIGTDVLDYPVVIFDINLRGQMPKFQNFLLVLDSKFPTSIVKQLSFTIPVVEEEEDTANLVLNIYSGKARVSAGSEILTAGKKPVAIFSDKKDITTALFKVKGSKWRIDWKVVATDSKWAGFSILVYGKGETTRYVDIFSHTGDSPEGTDYVYDDEGEFYLTVISANISSWEIKIYE